MTQNFMTYLGYQGTLECSDQGIWYGRVKNIRKTVIVYEAVNPEMAQAEFQASVDAYLQFSARHCIPLEQPDSL